MIMKIRACRDFDEYQKEQEVTVFLLANKHESELKCLYLLVSTDGYYATICVDNG
jgi:hypothetical protein